MAWPIWAGIAWEMCRAGFHFRALYTLFMVTTYMRPSEPLGLQKQDLVEPVGGVSRHWAVILFPDSRSARSKVYAKNETVDLHNKLAPWLEQLSPTLAKGRPKDLVFPFSYPEFLTTWRLVMKDFPIKVVPYQARHSGASLDAARENRSRKEIMDRGRWVTQGSLQRYEKHARLAASMTQLPRDWARYFEEAATHLEDLFFGRVAPDAVTRPPVAK